ncbi:hypothetical protein LSD46_003784 [Salmonella enterica subsp. enterica serovar Schwarzengrund]|nr:hypothetical protein [Salmonella enterica subsp. enterica serovar Muenster]EIP2213803.1 hypothetical protein [Salmonella enterica subsp. enterica serovar Schwarzengrund]EIS1581525.1 hypothetical protein [Salmonella enterica subsp. enterica serovar Brandenburg]ELA5060119.1 hypothetical protein [Salmonella enterica subsp. enterica serovar Brandenburg]EMC1194089.1 hypothetical protein [Salmonella enterica]
MVEAWKRVKANKGSAGADGLTIEQIVEHLKTRWPYIREALLNGTYRPQPVRCVEIPKPTGGTRELGIPTATDRLIQQALLQVLQPLIDPTFSEFSYGFRVVVDDDLEKFFDRVNHDILMDRLARRIADKAVLRLIQRYLQAGIMADGVVMARDKGTPQGGRTSTALEDRA